MVWGGLLCNASSAKEKVEDAESIFPVGERRVYLCLDVKSAIRYIVRHFRKAEIYPMYEFDKTDIKIVNLLLEDGRMSASEMSRRMGDISERAIRYRVDRMIDEGVIQISAVVSPEALGLNIKADVWLEVEADKVLEVAKKMAAFENVTYVACSIGQNDISIQVVAKDTSEVYYFVTEVIRKVPGVRKTTTSIVPIILKDVYQWRVPERIANEFSEKEII